MSKRTAPIALNGEEFRRLGYQLVDNLAEFIDTIPKRPVTPGEPPSLVRACLPQSGVPEEGCDPEQLLTETQDLLFDHSLLNGHPLFAGYITSPAAPLSTLAELLASNVNANLGAWILSPIATEIECQTLRWIAEMVSYPTHCGGVLVSGGNMANYVGLMVARYAKAQWNVREEGLCAQQSKKLCVYASKETHTWLQKATDLLGLGTQQIRWITTTPEHSMNVDALRQSIQQDINYGHQPFLVIGTAGSVSTGAVDPITQLREVCDEFDLWLHIDGAYGAFAAVSDDCPTELKHLALADSVAMDPHKWLYIPLEAGCVLVQDKELMRSTFSYRPPYYKMDEVGGEPTTDFVDYSPQNSRGFRALKVWMSLRHIGRRAYAQMISDDMRLARLMHQRAKEHDELEAFTQNLSITTFRFVPLSQEAHDENYLNQLNETLLTQLQESGKAFLSNAIIENRYLLRACIVNFRTEEKHIDEILQTVIDLGRCVHHQLMQT